MDIDTCATHRIAKRQKYIKRKILLLLQVTKIPKSDNIIKIIAHAIFLLLATGSFPSPVNIDPKVPHIK